MGKETFPLTMGHSFLRYLGKNGPTMGLLRGGRVHAVAATSVKELLAREPSAWAEEGGRVAPEEIGAILPPVAPPCQIICQGKNYLDHLLETGVKPQNKEHNLLFTKADSSLAPARGEVHRPEGVRLLDYEIELALVMRKDLLLPTKVTDENLFDYVAGLVMANDISARDVQIPERQWFRGKSFRGFCPLGPVFFYWERADLALLYELELELKVNGKTRQKAKASQLMHRPPETLSLISRSFDLRAGDLLLTGTPGGVSMKVKPQKWWQEMLGSLKSDKEKFAFFVESQAASGRYLKSGDRIEATIRTGDGAIDLGKQELTVS